MRELRIVTMEELKAQMREDWDGEDEVINIYGCAAEDAVVAATRRSHDELKRMGYEEIMGEKPGEVLPEGNFYPSRLKLAVLMLAAHSHRTREPVSAMAQNVVPYTIDLYIKPYVKLSDRDL